MNWNSINQFHNELDTYFKYFNYNNNNKVSFYLILLLAGTGSISEPSILPVLVELFLLYYRVINHQNSRIIKNSIFFFYLNFNLIKIDL